MSTRPCPMRHRWPGRRAHSRASRPSDAGMSHRFRGGRPLAAAGPSGARDAGPSTAACPSPPGTDAPTRPRASSWPARLRPSGGPTELTHRLGTCKRSRWAHQARTTGARLCGVSSVHEPRGQRSSFKTTQRSHWPAESSRRTDRSVRRPQSSEQTLRRPNEDERVAALALIRRRVHEVEAHVLGRADEVQMESLASRRRRDLRADERARAGEQHGGSGAEPHVCERRGSSDRRQSSAAKCNLVRLRPRLLCMMCSDAAVLTVSSRADEGRR